MRSISLFAATLVLAGCHSEAIPFRDLAARHEIASGQVMSRDCGNHGAVHYRFVADGRVHTGLAPSGFLNCSAVSVGDPVKVYYDPANPTVHTLKEPQLLYEEKRGFHLPVWLAVPLLFAVIFVFQVFNAKARGRARPVAEAPRNTQNASRRG